MLTYHPFNNVKKILLTNLNSNARSNQQGDFPSAPINILLTRSEYLRYCCGHFYAKSDWVSGLNIPLWCPQISYMHSCLSHHRHGRTTTRHHHKGAFHLSIQQGGGLLHFMLSLPNPIDQKNWARAQETQWCTPSSHYEKPAWFPCCRTFQQARTWTRRHGALQQLKQCRGTNSARHNDKMFLIFHLGTLEPHGLNVDFIF